MRIPWPARLYVWLFTSFALLVLYGPILAVVLLSFFSRKRGVIQWDTFTFDWYARLLEDDVTIAAVGNSLIVAAGVVPAALVLGTMFAFYYNGARGIGREIQQFIIFIPLLMPPIITGVSLLLFFRELDVDRSIATIMFGHMVFVLALVYRTVLARLQQLSPSLVEASYDLGAGPLADVLVCHAAQPADGPGHRWRPGAGDVLRRDLDHAVPHRIRHDHADPPVGQVARRIQA